MEEHKHSESEKKVVKGLILKELEKKRPCISNNYCCNTQNEVDCYLIHVFPSSKDPKDDWKMVNFCIQEGCIDKAVIKYLDLKKQK